MSFEDKIISGVKLEPLRLVVHGAAGAGKTSFVSEMPNVLFLDLEKGAGVLEMPRIKIDSYDELLTILKDILAAKEFNYSSLALDSTSKAFELIDKYLARREGMETVTTLDYGRGTAAIAAQFAILLGILEEIRNRHRCHIAIIAHSEIKTHTPPDSPSYDRYIISGSEKISSKFIQWADIIFFLKPEIVMKKQGQKNQAMATGQRLLISEDRPTHIAKTRLKLPATIPFKLGEGWQLVSEALKANRKGEKKNATE